MDARGVEDIKAQVRHWVAFVGARRLLIGTASTILVSIVGWLLVRPSGVPVESVIPLASVVQLPGLSATSTSTPATIKVHVAGAVRKPGVYTLSSSDRVIDAVLAAGGALSGADLDNINLAQTILDTEQIYVPRRLAHRSRITVAPRLKPRRDVSPTTVATNASTPAVNETNPGNMSGTSTRININTATAAQLDSLPGVGPTTAKSIISYRAKHGKFNKVEDLLNVAGIGPAKLAAMRDRVTV